MIKILRWITTIPLLFILVFICLNLLNTEKIPLQTTVNSIQPTSQSEKTSILAYNTEGGINYKLIANHIDYFAKEHITWFTKPSATIFDEKKLPTWMIKADLAKLTRNKILRLYGHVQVHNLTNAFQIQHIIMDNAVINLLTQDIYSDNIVTLHGIRFSATGMKMRGNLRNKTADLIENVHTFYEMQNS
ncbi:LPS export ABC transporter periplasmic protein LptC [Candidatus Curculioniphilus buchneri]|uniref:LPS export ABC transporter periplasmic protein LptC n=1 Tax=Candidatus Curculioniphilus buchneri TaxID=690594 RepID=UPI00376ECA0D